MLIAITVSTNFSDILEITLKQNLKFFDHWYIITQKNDKNTINLIQNIDKITILYFDFKTNNSSDFKTNYSSFNKGGAINYGQKIIYEQYNKSKILILDTDIYLPYNFDKIIEKESFQINTLYGSLIRLDFERLSDFYKIENFGYYENSDKFCGYFQLYYFDRTIPNNINYYYGQSYHCGDCDNLFKKLFQNFKTLEINVYHLGKANIHWLGRENMSDFIIDTKLIN